MMREMDVMASGRTARTASMTTTKGGAKPTAGMPVDNAEPDVAVAVYEPPVPKQDDIILLSNAWFGRRKRTGKEWSRHTHAMISALLVVIFVLNCISLYVPSMLRENYVSEPNRARCHLGCYGYDCGVADELTGMVKFPSCRKVRTPFKICRYISPIGIGFLAICCICELLETVKPGLLSIRYRYVLAPLLAFTGCMMLFIVLLMLVLVIRPYCEGLVIAQSYHLHYGWIMLVFTTIILFYLSYTVWRGRKDG